MINDYKEKNEPLSDELDMTIDDAPLSLLLSVSSLSSRHGIRLVT